MRVLVAHNRYRSTAPSGENLAVDTEVGLLREAGVDVATFIRSSDDIPSLPLARKVSVATGPVVNWHGTRDFARTLREFRPDVVHVHNVYPMLSPKVVTAAQRAGVPVVHTMHNYRLGCVAGTYLRGGTVCRLCDSHPSNWPAVRYGCYRESRVQSVAMGVGSAMTRRTWQSVERLLALTPFMAQVLQSLGIDESRIRLHPTAVPDPGPMEPPGRGLLFLGRLDDMKGVPTLLEAWRMASPRNCVLTIAGDGPLRPLVESAARKDPSINFLGPVPGPDAQSLLAGCRAVLVPSAYYEGFPRVVVEAFAAGRAVVARAIGSLDSVVDDEVGWKFGTADELARLLPLVTASASASKGRAARLRYVRNYSPRAALESLLSVYAEVSR